MNKQNLDEVLEYINLNLNKVPKSLKILNDINIKSSDLKLKNNYKVYKYVNINDIQIMLTNTHRIDEASKKIENINTLDYYLNKKNKEEYNALINLFSNISVTDIEEIEREQLKFEKTPPKTIKYNKDYLWQIYYIENLNQYFMIVPIQETEHQAFAYLLKKIIAKENKKIYVPICNLEYQNDVFQANMVAQLEDILKFFTGNWPSTYEVYNTENNLSLNIIGSIDILETIKSDYKLYFDNKESIISFYELIKTLFFIQTELPNYYNFNIVLDKNGGIHFFYKNEEVMNTNLNDFYKNEINNILKNISEIKDIKNILKNKLENLKAEDKKLSAELFYKQKQISAFLEYKKTFIGKIKFFFKKTKKNNLTKLDEYIPENSNSDVNNFTLIDEDLNNDAEDLIYICKKLQSETNDASTIRMDIKNLTLKLEILKKKNDNASLYLKEIDKHKKNIFDFWKFTNKDEQKQLEEATTTKNHVETKIRRSFNFKDDFEIFAQKIDLVQRKILEENELNTILISNTKVLDDINLLINNGKITSENYEKNKEQQNCSDIIYNNKISHREKPRKLDTIIDTFNKNFNIYEEDVGKYLKNLNEIFKKCKAQNNIVAYSSIKPKNELTKFDFNPQKIIDEIDGKNITLVKINLKEGTPIVAFTNIIFFYNRNKTLPLGMDYSTKLIADLRENKILKINENTNYLIDLSQNTVRKIVIKEFNN